MAVTVVVAVVVSVAVAPAPAVAVVSIGKETAVVGASVVEEEESSGMVSWKAGLKTGSWSPWRRASW